MTGHLTRVRSGDPLGIPAVAYNAFVDAAHVTRRINADVGRPPAASPAHETHVLVRNDSGEDLPRFGVLGIVGPILEPGDDLKRRTAVVGAAITIGDDYAGRFVVAREPIAPGRIGWAVVRGVTPAIVHVVDNQHVHADTYSDQQFLRSGLTGAARILWKEPGLGQRLAIIEIGPADRDRVAARLGTAHAIGQQPFGWVYDWEEVRLDADPFSLTFGQYIRLFGAGWLSSGGNPLKRAFNRYEAHLSVMHPQGGGTEGFARAGACILPGVLENCPPARAAVPMLQPIPKGVVVELRAERTLHGDTRWVFEAMTPAVFCEMNVPGGLYG